MSTSSSGAAPPLVPALVHATRERLYAAGFRPVPIYNHDFDGSSPGKRPLGKNWGDDARRDPPVCVEAQPVSHALNTGILCDGLRAIDIDVDDRDRAHALKALALDMFGEAPMRYRANSPRVLLLYRASDGKPVKRSLVNRSTNEKIEALGKGQQFVAFGIHDTGAALCWMPEQPGDIEASDLPSISESALTDFFTRAAPILGADPPGAHSTAEHVTSARGLSSADALQVVAALIAIPNTGGADWEHMNKIGMAAWAASNGSEAGRAAFHAWASLHPTYDPAVINERWDHYPSSPPTRIGAGTLFHWAKEATQEEPPEPPEEQEDPAYTASLLADAQMAQERWEDVLHREVGETTAATQAAKVFDDTLWVLTDEWDESAIPTRPWIAKGYMMRRSVTVVSGPGSAGKSSLMVAWAAALASGRSYHGLKISSTFKVAIYNVEDDQSEQKRRFSAMLRHLKINHAVLGGRLAVIGPKDVGTLLLPPLRDGGTLLHTPVMQKLEEFIKEFHPDVLILDPFVELHAAEENDNTAVRAVMAKFRSLAVEHDMSIVILHHARKGAGTPGDPDSLRGASSIVGAARVALTLNVMTEQEAESFTLPPERRRDFFRVDGAKNNYAPIDEAEWFERQEIKLSNGDGVAVAVPFIPVEPARTIPASDLNKALDRISDGPETGLLYSFTKRGRRNDRWAGAVLMNMFSMTEAAAQRLLKSWIKDGTIYEDDFLDPHRNPRKGVRVNNEMRPQE